MYIKIKTIRSWEGTLSTQQESLPLEGIALEGLGPTDPRS